MLKPVNGQAQALLDELAGLMKAGTIRISPLACLRGMVRKAKAGEFTSEYGVKIAKVRLKRAENERRLLAVEIKPKPPPTVDIEQAKKNLSTLRQAMHGKGTGAANEQQRGEKS